MGRLPEMVKAPRFSVVIPTFNRADLIGYAIRSVLNQSFKDFELIVYDNYSEDNTGEIVNNFTDTRIKYFYADRHRPAGENWECGRKLAGGDYIIMLNDDDALVESALEEFDHLAKRHDAELMICGSAEYISGKIRGVGADRVYCPPFTGKAVRVFSDEYLRLLFSFNFKYNPHPSCVAFSRLTAKTVEDRCGYLFRQPAPEYFAWGAVAALAEKIACIDLPLAIMGRTPKSWGVLTVLSNPGKEALKEIRRIYENEFKIEHSPVKIKNLTNTIAEALFQLKICFPEELNAYELDRERYLRRIAGEVADRISKGVEMKHEVEEISGYLTEHFPNLGAYFNKESKKLSTKMRMGRLRQMFRYFYNILRKIPDYSVYVRYLLIFMRKDVHRAGFKGLGFTYRFTNVYDCSKFIANVIKRERTHILIYNYKK